MNGCELLLQRATELQGSSFAVARSAGPKHTQQHHWTAGWTLRGSAFGLREVTGSCACRRAWISGIEVSCLELPQSRGSCIHTGACQADLSSRPTSIRRPVASHESLQFTQDQHHAQAILGVDPVGRSCGPSQRPSAIRQIPRRFGASSAGGYLSKAVGCTVFSGPPRSVSPRSHCPLGLYMLSPACWNSRCTPLSHHSEQCPRQSLCALEGAL